MRQKNAPLVIGVAVVAVAAVVVGGVLGYRQRPQTDSGAASPLSGSTPTSSRPSTPTGTPSATPSTTASTPTPNGPVKVAVKLSKLAKGRDPQVPYLVGREVRGGAGSPVKIPGTGQIQAVARLGDTVLAIVTKGSGTEMLRIAYTGEVTRTPDVSSLVTNEDGYQAAYAATRSGSGGQQLVGATVYADLTGEGGTVAKLARPNSWNLQVITVTKDKVYFTESDKESGQTWRLFEWTPGEASATLIKTVAAPTAISPDGTTAGSLPVISSGAACAAAIEVATGKRLWKTCEYGIRGFTADSKTAIGGPAYQDGYADGLASAIDAKAGTLLREWNGISFRQTVAEDDQNLLFLADDGPETKAAIIRCSIPTGTCELATPLAPGELLLGS